MKAPRSVIHTHAPPVAHGMQDGPREFLSVAIRISAATSGKEGFFVQLFSDLRPPQSIYVTNVQLERLLTLAESSASEAEVWAELAKIPLEPLAPSRSLYGRFRTLLTDCASPLRDDIAAQERAAAARRQPEPVVRESIVEPQVASRPDHDPDAL